VKKKIRFMALRIGGLETRLIDIQVRKQHGLENVA